jgi:hypothetical protein
MKGDAAGKLPLCVEDGDTTDDWLLTTDHWFKINTSVWLRAPVYFSSVVLFGASYSKNRVKRR